MPEKARVYIIEDDPEWRERIKEYLIDAGHIVVGEDSNKAEVIENIQKYSELGVQVATIDGNLTMMDASGKDGKEINEKIKKETPNVKTVGLASFPVEGADINLDKKDMRNLGKIINDI